LYVERLTEGFGSRLPVSLAMAYQTQIDVGWRQVRDQADQRLELSRGIVKAILLASLDAALRVGSGFG
jgi:hypothetical protein